MFFLKSSKLAATLSIDIAGQSLRQKNSQKLINLKLPAELWATFFTSLSQHRSCHCLKTFIGEGDEKNGEASCDKVNTPVLTLHEKFIVMSLFPIHDSLESDRPTHFKMTILKSFTGNLASTCTLSLFPS